VELKVSAPADSSVPVVLNHAGASLTQRRTEMKLKIGLISLVTTALLFCGTARAHAETTNLRLAFNGFGGTAPIYLGQDAGIFKKHNLNLEMIFIPGGSLSLQALIGKSLEVLLTGGPPVVNAYLQGAKIKIVGGVINLLPYTFVATGGIRAPEQLKGKKIGISRFGSNTEYVVRLALNQFALNPGEVQIIQVGGSQARLAAMKSGAIQATVLSPEEAVVAQKMGYGILLDFIDKGIEFPHVNFVVRNEFIETQPQTLRTFLRAYLESLRYFKTHRNEAVSKIVSLSKLLDRQMGELVYDDSLRSTPDDGKPTLKGMEVVLDAVAKDNPKARGLTVQQLVDLRYIP
jgi:NitT/TauT family transport system substrate-binding protein